MAKGSKKVTDGNTFDFTVARAIDIGRGLLYGLNDAGKRVPVEVRQESVLGGLGSYKSYINETTCVNQDNFSQPNPKPTGSDGAFVPAGCDRVSLQYSVVFRKPKYLMSNGGALTVISMVEKAWESDKYSLELARRYFWNMVNGRTLWRNRLGGGVDTILTCVGLQIKDVKWPVYLRYEDDDLEYYRSGYEADMSAYCKADDGTVVNLDNEFFDAVFKAISDAIRGKRIVTMFSVENIIQTMPGMIVYPSQEFNPNKDEKTLYKVDQDGIPQAAVHSQKIGNAIRTIDDWYSPDEVKVNPVEFFGYNKEDGIPKRHFADRKASQQTLCIYYYITQDAENLLNVVTGATPATEKTQRDILYVLAVMCRGGILTTREKATSEE